MFANDAAARLCGFDSAAAHARGSSGNEILDELRHLPRGRDAVSAGGAAGPAGAAGADVERDRAVPTQANRRGAVVVRVGRAGRRRRRQGRSVGQRVPRVHGAPPQRAGVAVPGGRERGARVVAGVSRRRSSRSPTLAVPTIADWCGGRRPRARTARSNSSRWPTSIRRSVELAKEWRRRWPPPPGVQPDRVVRVRRCPSCIPEITDGDDRSRDAGSRTAAHGALRSACARRWWCRSSSGKKPFGAMSFITAESGRRYRPRGSDPRHRDRRGGRRWPSRTRAPTPRRGWRSRRATTSSPSPRTSCARRSPP